MFGLTKGSTFAAGATATAVVAVAAGALVYRNLHVSGSPSAPTSPAAAVVATAPEPTKQPPVVAGIAEAPKPPVAGSTLPTAQPMAASQASKQEPPAFDVVRVEPSGDAVVAGRATPNSNVSLLDRGAVIAEMKADSNGQFAFVPPPLPAGDHLLALGEKSGGAEIVSPQTVAIAVPKKKSPQGVVVALTEPDKPTRILSDAIPEAVDGTQKSSGNPVVTIRTVEMEDKGGFFATGSAPPGAEVKLYLNGSAVADVRAGDDGHWSLQITKGMQPGSYAVRADEIDPPSGKVVARAEVPFDYKAVVAVANGAVQVTSKQVTSKADGTGGGGAMLTASGTATAQQSSDRSLANATPNDAVIAAISTLTVVRGDSLWRISRKVLGRGIRYTQIYAANVSQIRDPDLIYPGQVLVKPQTGVN
ncbi:MAG TPA: LysM peptidoglycan-binding domain-containing protein [Beijerinckiaceae bacterium]|nr:LysM peptidoglycan-binding domain-containing protein [Beijerinckiaceae bacterium]